MSVQAETGWDRGKRERRKRILRAARELVREDPAGFTTQALASRAGVSPATVFNLVGTREEIWAALGDEVLGGMDFAAHRSAVPLDRARGIVDVVVDAIEEDPIVVRALILAWSESGTVIQQDPTYAFIRALEEAAEESERPAPALAARLGELLSTGLVGGVHQWAAGLVDAAQLRARLHLLVEVLHHAAVTSSTPIQPHHQEDLP